MKKSIKFYQYSRSPIIIVTSSITSRYLPAAMKMYQLTLEKKLSQIVEPTPGEGCTKGRVPQNPTLL